MNFKIVPHSDTSATLAIELKPYTDAYHALKANQISNQQYAEKHAELIHGVERIHAEELWEDLFKHTTHNMDAAAKQAILETPAYFFMQQQFVELLKNSIDALLAPHMNTHTHTNSGDDILHLTLNIENDDPNEITLTLTDNATGFPSEFLGKIATKITREHTDYYQTRGSHKYGGKDNLLIGGAGKGLRMLAALVDHGEKITGPMDREAYCNIPQKSNLVFSNKTQPEHGAVISITTSKAPLILHAQPATDAPIMMLPSRFKKLPPLKATTEPKPSRTRKNLDEARRSDEALNPGSQEKTGTLKQALNKLRISDPKHARLSKSKDDSKKGDDGNTSRSR